ncbi:TetR/AcrR family transcriptional regulator [Marispirochaeta aestuarii]|nr:TetR/AcrR family transcriptional regulator [Marispirochaeta aestuarii]
MKNRIIQGAAELFTRFGYAKVRMEEISERLGISKKTIYNHFASKETLFNSMIETMVERISSEMERITDDLSIPFPEKLNRILEHAYHEIGMKDSAFFKDLNRYHEGLDSRPIVLLRESTLDVITKLIQQAEEEGIIAVSIPRQRLAQVFQNIVEGVTSQKHREESAVSRVQVLKDSVKITLEGILTPKGRDLLTDSVLKPVIPLEG